MSSRGKNTPAVVISLILVLLTTLLLVACEPTAPIRIRNETNEVLQVYVNGTHIGTVEPHKELKNTSVHIIFNYTIEVKDAQGKVIYSEKFTHDEIKWLEWKILIPASSQ